MSIQPSEVSNFSKQMVYEKVLRVEEGETNFVKFATFLFSNQKMVQCNFF